MRDADPPFFFIGVTQDGRRQDEAHLVNEGNTGLMLFISECGYGWAGNADLYTVAAVVAAWATRSASGAWSRDTPTPIAWVRPCPACRRIATEKGYIPQTNVA